MRTHGMRAHGMHTHGMRMHWMCVHRMHTHGMCAHGMRTHGMRAHGMRTHGMCTSRGRGRHPRYACGCASREACENRMTGAGVEHGVCKRVCRQEVLGGGARRQKMAVLNSLFVRDLCCGHACPQLCCAACGRRLSTLLPVPCQR
eukprot:245533-Chlamydomonas_euryale.AAC.1